MEYSSWLFLISFAFLTITVAQQDPLYHLCLDGQGNFTKNSTYEENLDRLLSSFSSPNTANDYGFYNMSSGQGSDVANVIALCRGDVNSDVCHECINTSITELRNRCPNQREATIGYEDCMLRYSNRSIFGVAEFYPYITRQNPNNVTDVEAFNLVLDALLRSLISKASSGNSLVKFATGSADVAAFQTIYALVQCTPDLTSLDCSSCLTEFAALIPTCCDAKQGGRVNWHSCYLRFESYRFYNLTAADAPLQSPPPAPESSLSPPPSNDNTTKTTMGEKSNSTPTIIIITVSVVAFAVLLISCCIFFFLRVRKSKVKVETPEVNEPVDEIRNAECLQYDFNIISVATDDFSDANKLGQGGFGAVYKGKLASGELIAVKRLAKDSGQGDIEFKNEVQLVAKLQHRNLVRLLGFCLERNERLLIYEFVPNASLDQFLFDPVKSANLDWERRYKIIGGIARGLLYLHEDSPLRVIHRDLKASNVLLDAKMNPKIADFGMARLCPLDQTQGATTSRIVGTYGYMAPEYAMHGQFSAKSDVFSFGVLVLEILSGQKNSAFSNGDNIEDLLSFAWRNWKDGTAMNVVDSSLRDGSRIELMRCIHIGLLCVQENVALRPNMASVVLILLSTYSVTLPLPSEPAFFLHSNTQSNIVWLQDFNSGATDSNNDSRNELADEKSRAIISIQSRNEVAAPVSVNDVTITEMYPR